MYFNNKQKSFGFMSSPGVMWQQHLGFDSPGVWKPHFFDRENLIFSRQQWIVWHSNSLSLVLWMKGFWLWPESKIAFTYKLFFFLFEIHTEKHSSNLYTTFSFNNLNSTEQCRVKHLALVDLVLNLIIPSGLAMH